MIYQLTLTDCYGDTWNGGSSGYSFDITYDGSTYLLELVVMFQNLYQILCNW